MRRYSSDEEQRVLLQRAVRDWTRSGLLSREQCVRLDLDLQTELRRTGLMLRLGLAVFTVIAVSALIGLAFVTLDLRSERRVAELAGVFGIACFAAADALVGRFRLYRYGLEEALAAVSVALCGASAAFLTSIDVSGPHHAGLVEASGFGVCAIVSAAAYARFGFRYAAVAGMFFAAVIPFTLREFSVPAKHIGAALLCACAFGVSRWMVRSAGDEVREVDGSVLGSAAVIGGYMALNLYLDVGPSAFFAVGNPGQGIAPWFKWTSYVLTWVVPVFGVWRGFLDRDRNLMGAGGLVALLTLVTNKSYLGWPRQTWDPMLLGVLLMAVALATRRWLSTGPDGERGGFTAARLLQSDADTVRLVAILSAAAQPETRPAAPTDHPQFGGGRSGGGGASGEF